MLDVLGWLGVGRVRLDVLGWLGVGRVRLAGCWTC